MSRICLCKCVHHIKKINLENERETVCNYFVTLCYHKTSQKKIGPRSYMCGANQVVWFCLYDED